MKKFLFIVMVSSLAFVSAKDAGWKFEFDKNGIKVWTRKTDISKFKEFKSEAIIKSNIGSILYVFDDVDNFTNWVYNCTKAKLVKKESPFRGVVYVELKMPWPVTNRDMVYRYVMTQNKRTKVVTVTFTSIIDNSIPTNGNVRMTDAKSTYVLTPLDANRVKIEFYSLADPAGSIPKSIVNMFIRDTPYQTLLKLRGIVEAPSFGRKQMPHFEDF
ncbi:MAG: START domain-containing protein [Bacteroidales bacterium]|jgi:hypothetical protein|nr:START domain-containing protein [Bacteroidales bacterium]